MSVPREIWERAQETLGAKGLAGCALVALSLALFVGLVLPQREARDTLRDKAHALQQRGGALADARPPRAGVSEQLRTFYGFFPAQETSAHWLRRIHAAAAKEGLALHSGEYRLKRESGSRLARYQVTLPVKGSYVQIQRFIAAVLAQVPPAALDEIVLKRDSVAEQSLEARIRLTIFFGDST